MTPCENLGYKVGDRFEVLYPNNSGFVIGQVITLFRDDGTNCPIFAGDNQTFICVDGAPGAYMLLEHVRKIKTTLTEQLSSAITKRDKQEAKVKRHAEKLEQKEAEVQRLIGEIEREIEEVTGLQCSIGGSLDIPDSVDINDPSTWNIGDVIECVFSKDIWFTKGCKYEFDGLDAVGDPIIKEDDEGDRSSPERTDARFRFVSRQ